MGEIQEKLQEVKDAIAAEKVEVNNKLTVLSDRITQLEDQLNSGDPVTLAQLDELKTAVNDIFTEPAPEPVPEP